MSTNPAQPFPGGYPGGPNQNPQLEQINNTLQGQHLANQSTIFGILGLFLLGIVFGPLAIVKAKQAERLGVSSTIGKVLGWISVVLIFTEAAAAILLWAVLFSTMKSASYSNNVIATSAPVSANNNSTVHYSVASSPASLEDPQMSAENKLDQLVNESSMTLDGHWVIQLSSKWNGVTDDSAIAANGTHTFSYQDILTEYQNNAARFGNDTKLVDSTLFGKQLHIAAKPDNARLYVTVLDSGDFNNQSAAEGWCQKEFPSLSGDSLDNVCLPRQAYPPSQG